MAHNNKNSGIRPEDLPESYRHLHPHYRPASQACSSPSGELPKQQSCDSDGSCDSDRNCGELNADNIQAHIEEEQKKTRQAQEPLRQKRLKQLNDDAQWEGEAPAEPGGERDASVEPGLGLDPNLRSSVPICGQHRSALGTPLSPRWSEDWADLVNQTEARLGRRCCGAHAHDDQPCELEASHESGRCRFHGGAPNSGAQHGNANARVHGLYSKRLLQCGTHCPKWDCCPYAGDDVKALPPEKRPDCFYEIHELHALRQLDEFAHERYIPLEDRELEDLKDAPYPVHAQLTMLRENLNMYQVMLTRAARALATEAFTSETEQRTEHWHQTHTKLNPLLQAHNNLAREHRLTLALYNKTLQQHGMPKYSSP